LPIRRVYRQIAEDKRAAYGDPFSTKHENCFLRWATDPASVDDQYSPFMRTLYDLRPDVATAYPDIRGKDRHEFLQWTATSGPRDFGFDPAAMGVFDNGRPAAERIIAVDSKLELPAESRGPECSIVIPVHNNASLTRNCLENILATVPAGIDHEIIVVD